MEYSIGAAVVLIDDDQRIVTQIQSLDKTSGLYMTDYSCDYYSLGQLEAIETANFYINPCWLLTDNSKWQAEKFMFRRIFDFITQEVTKYGFHTSIVDNYVMVVADKSLEEISHKLKKISQLIQAVDKVVSRKCFGKQITVKTEYLNQIQALSYIQI